MSPLIAAVSNPSVACSMLAVQQQKRLCRQFVDVSAARRGCHMTKRGVDRSGILATDVRRSEMYSSVYPRSDLSTSKHNLYWILS